MPASCCSEASTSGASCGSRTATAARAVSSRRTRGPRWCSSGCRLHRQVRVTGTVTPIYDAESDAYFATRPATARSARGRRCRARCSTTERRSTHAVADIEERYRGIEVSRPPHWGGYRLAHETRRVLAGPSQPAARSLPLHPWDATAGRSTASGPRTQVDGGSAPSPRSTRRSAARDPGPSQSFQTGLRPRTRGGSSSCTPPPRGRFAGFSGCSPRNADGIVVEVGGDRVVRERGPQVRRDMVGEVRFCPPTSSVVQKPSRP